MIILLDSIKFYGDSSYVGVTTDDLYHYSTPDHSDAADNSKEECFEAVINLIKDIAKDVVPLSIKEKVVYTDIFSYKKKDIYKFILKKERF